MMTEEPEREKIIETRKSEDPSLGKKEVRNWVQYEERPNSGKGNTGGDRWEIHPFKITVEDDKSGGARSNRGAVRVAVSPERLKKT